VCVCVCAHISVYNKWFLCYFQSNSEASFCLNTFLAILLKKNVLNVITAVSQFVVLLFSNNRISNKGAIALGHGIGKNKGLETLLVSGQILYILHII